MRGRLAARAGPSGTSATDQSRAAACLQNMRTKDIQAETVGRRRSVSVPPSHWLKPDRGPEAAARVALGGAGRRSRPGSGGQYAAALLAQRGSHRQDALHEEGALRALRPEARASPQPRVPQRPLGAVVGRLYAWHWLVLLIIQSPLIWNFSLPI